MSRLNDLIRQLHQNNPALADDIRREVAALADRRSFGLNFERHVPEAVELPGRRVRRGDKVRVLPPRGTTTGGDERLWQVTSVTHDEQRGSTAELALLPDHDETSDSPVDDLVVVAEFRDPIYPGLVSTGRLEHGGESPFHCVINAENYHALQTLLFTHRGKVDCIYIDPPYNTGNDEWIYSDRYVSGDDLYRHSKWLAFLERRLVLARELLKDTGVIIVAIGEDQHHRLRMLLEQIFDESNFLASVMWEGVRKNDSRYVSASADYMLMFARDESAMSANSIRWRELKPGAGLVMEAGSEAWENSMGDATKATSLLKQWWAALPADHAARTHNGLSVFSLVDDVRPGSVYSTSPMMSPNPRANLRYPVTDPATGREFPPPTNGWRVERAVMDQYIREGRLAFGRTTLRRKVYLEDATSQGAGPYFLQTRSRASGHLKDLLGEQRFPNPKDHEILARWIGMVAPKDGLVLDFFGGSGSTVEAVARLNTGDNGTRQVLLVSNNEVGSAEARAMTKAGHRHGEAEWEAKGVHEYVTKPRVTSMVTGKRPDGSTHDDTVAANVEFFTLTYEAPLRVQSHREFDHVAPLLWMRAGSQGRRIETLPDGWDVADAYGVLADLDQAAKFINALDNAPGARIAFIVTDEDRIFESVVRELPEHVEPVRLYEAYLRNFEIESGRGTR